MDAHAGYWSRQPRACLAEASSLAAASAGWMLPSSPGCSTYSLLARLALGSSDSLIGCLPLHFPPQVGDLMPALKARFQDANRNLGAQTLLLLASLAKAMGKPIAREARPILGPGVKCICDSKPQVRPQCFLHQARRQCGHSLLKTVCMPAHYHGSPAHTARAASTCGHLYCLACVLAARSVRP